MINLTIKHGETRKRTYEKWWLDFQGRCLLGLEIWGPVRTDIESAMWNQSTASDNFPWRRAMGVLGSLGPIPWKIWLEMAWIYGKLVALRILDPPMEGWKNLYSRVRVLKIASFAGPMILRAVNIPVPWIVSSGKSNITWAGTSTHFDGIYQERWGNFPVSYVTVTLPECSVLRICSWHLYTIQKKTKNRQLECVSLKSIPHPASQARPSKIIVPWKCWWNKSLQKKQCIFSNRPAFNYLLVVPNIALAGISTCSIGNRSSFRVYFPAIAMWVDSRV